MVLAAVFSAQMLSFAGKTPVELSELLGKTSGAPVYIASFAEIPSFSVETPTERKEYNKVAKLANLDWAGGDGEDDLAFRPPTWPVFYPSRQGMSDFERKFPPKNWTALSAADGFVQINNNQAVAFTLNDLTTLKFSGPVVIHWFYAKYKVAVSLPQNTSEADFFRGVAKSVGGKALKRGSRHFIEIDPVVFRKQWIEFYNNYSSEPGTKTLDNLSREMRKAFVGLLTDQAIVGVMSSPDMSIVAPIPAGSKAHELSLAFLDAFAKETTNKTPESIKRDLEFRRNYVGGVDLTKPMYFGIDASGFVTLNCTGKKVAYVRF